MLKLNLAERRIDRLRDRGGVPLFRDRRRSFFPSSHRSSHSPTPIFDASGKVPRSASLSSSASFASASFLLPVTVTKVGEPLDAFGFLIRVPNAQAHNPRSFHSCRLVILAPTPANAFLETIIAAAKYVAAVEKAVLAATEAAIAAKLAEEARQRGGGRSAGSESNKDFGGDCGGGEG